MSFVVTRSARSRRAAVVGLLGTLVLGCTSSSESPEPTETATTCDKDTRKDVYTQGLTKTGGAFVVKVLESTPAPPAKSMNTMTFQITDPSGKAIDGAKVTVLPWMPDHAHGSAVTPVVEPKGDGTYAVTKIYYPMPGLWRLTITVQAPGAAPQDVVFQFCLEG